MAQAISKAAIRRALDSYLQQYRRYPFYFAIGFLAPAVGAILVFYAPALFVSDIVDRMIANPGISTGDLFVPVLLFAVVWFIGEMIWRFAMHYVIKAQIFSIRDLTMYAFQQLLERDYQFYTNNFVGSLTKKALAFSRNFETFTDTIVFNISTFLGPLFFSFFVLARYSWWLPIVLVAWLALGVAIAIPLIRRRVKMVAARHAAQSKVAGRLSDVISNILAIKAFAREPVEHKEYERLVYDYSVKARKSWDFQNLNIEMKLSPVYVLTNVAGLLLAIYYSQRLGLSPGSVFVIFSFYSGLSRVFWEINRIYRNIESSLTEAAEYTELIIRPPEIVDVENASELVIDSGEINFSKIYFHYDDVERKRDSFIRGLDLNIRPGERVGLVGPSGGGKTTITKLLLRFKDVPYGSISIDGQNIAKVTQHSLHSAISYVPQEAMLFHRSIAENIRYGRPEASDDEVVQAAVLANASEFIDDLPNGYDTLVGERGIKLSGGQKQRIAIARAMIKDAPILVLDEATSALDSASEKLIQDALWKLMEGRTAIVIAHRLSTIQRMDRIVVLESGSVVEHGTHKELLNKSKGAYARLWAHQTGGFIE